MWEALPSLCSNSPRRQIDAAVARGRIPVCDSQGHHWYILYIAQLYVIVAIYSRNPKAYKIRKHEKPKAIQLYFSCTSVRIMSRALDIVRTGLLKRLKMEISAHDVERL